MQNKTFQPIIKWTGSKRSQSFEIINKFPKEIDTYFEPFLGGGSVFRALTDSDVKVKHYVLSDLNDDLIELWKNVKYNKDGLSESYRELWNQLNKDNDIERKKEYYYSIRKHFNKYHNSYEFNFLLRESLNGMVRYNNKGEFNSPFHFNRKGIEPDRFDNILEEWSTILNNHDIELVNQSYDMINPKENDFVYFDPPYFNTKGLYYGLIDFEKFWNFLRELKCGYALSFDGKVGDNVMTYDVPSDLYDKHVYINSGKSSFRRLINTVKDNKDEKVFESLYIKN